MKRWFRKVRRCKMADEQGFGLQKDGSYVVKLGRYLQMVNETPSYLIHDTWTRSLWGAIVAWCKG